MKAKYFYVNVPESAILDKNISGNELRYLEYLQLRRGKDDYAFPSTRTSAKDLGLHETTIDRMNTHLKRLGYLSISKEYSYHKQKNTYRMSRTTGRKMRQDPGAKSARGYYSLTETAPVQEKQGGLKAGAKRETPREKIMRKSKQETISRREQLKQAKQQAEQQKTTNPPDKEVNHGTK